jgi:DNA ligase-1
MPFKPMLATAIEDVSTIKFPVLASQKLDGIRATVQGGQLLSRSLKPIPNVFVQAFFKGLPDGLDGELILGDPFAKDVYRQTVSVVMSDAKPAAGVHFHVFDMFGSEGFAVRLSRAGECLNSLCALVDHNIIHNLTELEAMENDLLEAGAEGVMLRKIDGPYKTGRSSLKEGYLLKLKRFKDTEARVIGFFELNHNDNVAFTNELGRTARSSHKENKVGLGALGGLIVVGLEGDYEGVEFRVGTGFDAATRQELWDVAPSLVGEIAKIKYFPSGSKDKPRHPVFLGLRDGRDL